MWHCNYQLTQYGEIMTVKFKMMVLLFAGVMFSFVSHAQMYEIDNLYGDSIDLKKAEKNEKGEYYGGEKALTLANGTLVNVKETVETFGVLVEYEGNYYVTYPGYLKFSKKNPSGVENTWQDVSERRQHSALGHFWYTLIPYYIILAILLAVGIMLLLLQMVKKFASLESTLLLWIPIGLFAASLLELIGYFTLGDDFIWWCSVDRQGFWPAFITMLPFMLALVIQLGSGVLYKRYQEKKYDVKLSWRSIFIGIAGVPIAIVILVILAICGMKNPVVQDVVSAILILASLAIGFLYALAKNRKVLGNRNGLFFTLFSFVYAAGAVIALIFLAVIIVKLILIVLMWLLAIAGCIFAIAFLSSSDSGSSGGGSSSTTVTYWEDADGNRHTNEADAKAANKRIAERKAGL